MMKNCWQYKNCGREIGGSKVDEFGVCPASFESKVDGINSGDFGGRCCWVVAGTYCGGKIQGTLALKASDCMYCEFFQLVLREESKTYSYSKIPDILNKLK